MRFFVNGRLDIRALSQQDKPFASIPYNTITERATINDLVADDTGEATIDSDDWGADMAFLCYGCLWNITSITGDPLGANDKGFVLQLQNEDSDGGNEEDYYLETITGYDRHAITYNGSWAVKGTIWIPGGFYTESTRQVTLVLANISDQVISCVARFLGLAINEY